MLRRCPFLALVLLAASIAAQEQPQAGTKKETMKVQVNVMNVCTPGDEEKQDDECDALQLHPPAP